MQETETIVLSVGGSLIVPEEVDTEFLLTLKNFIVAEAAEGRYFVIITGGGKTSRRYGQSLRAFPDTTDEDVDRIGIAACQLNAELLRLIFKDVSVKINPDPDLYQPGASSDRAAVRTALKHGAKKVINLSNISHVYTADPKTDPTATAIDDITWEEFRRLIPDEFTPNLSAPFDPTAAREAQENDIEVATISGQQIDELRKYVGGEAFTGTRIHS